MDFRTSSCRFFLLILVAGCMSYAVAGASEDSMAYKFEHYSKTLFTCRLEAKTQFLSDKRAPQIQGSEFTISFTGMKRLPGNKVQFSGELALTQKGAKNASWTNEVFTITLDRLGNIQGIDWKPKSLAAAVPLAAGLSGCFVPLAAHSVVEGQTWESSEQRFFRTLKIPYLDKKQVLTWEKTTSQDKTRLANIESWQQDLVRPPGQENGHAVIIFKSKRICLFDIAKGTVFRNIYVSRTEDTLSQMLTVYTVRCQGVAKGKDD